MTSVDRTTLLKGPAYVTHDGVSIKFASDFSVDLIEEKFPVSSSSHGRIGNRVKDRRLEVKGTPLEWTNLPKLFPHATSQPYDLIFGTTDKPLVVVPKTGAPLTLANAAVTKMPGITLHPSKPILRDMMWTGLIANASDPSLAASWFSWGSVASNVTQTAAALASIPNAFYSGAFNSLTLKPEDGFDIDFNLSTDPDMQDGMTVGMRMANLEAAVKFRPINLTEAQYATLMGWNTFQPGDDSYSGNLVLTGDKSGKPTITLSKMQVISGSVNYGRATRTGDVTMTSIRDVSSDLLTALWTFGTVA